MMARGSDARWLIIFSLLVVSGALYWMTGLNLEAPMGYLIQLRIVQTFALALFFVPIQSAAYLYLPKDQINNATGMVSMVRNEGASLGVAILNTLLTRRAQFHQLRLGEHINSVSHATNQALAGAMRLSHAAGAGPHSAYQQASALIYRVLQRQAMGMAYLDAFLVFSLMALAVIPLVFLMRRSVTDGGTAQVV
jgi:DHA2 family multidrug resistance protein